MRCTGATFIDFSSYRYRNGHGRRKASLKRCLPRSSRTILRSAQEAEVEIQKQAKFRVPPSALKRKTRRKINFQPQTHKHIQMQIQAYLLDIARSSTIQAVRPLSCFVYATTMRNPEQRATVWGKTTPTRDRHERGRTRPTPRDLSRAGMGTMSRCHRDHFVASAERSVLLLTKENFSSKAKEGSTGR